MRKILSVAFVLLTVILCGEEVSRQKAATASSEEVSITLNVKGFVDSEVISPIERYTDKMTDGQINRLLLIMIFLSLFTACAIVIALREYRSSANKRWAHNSCRAGVNFKTIVKTLSSSQ